jgi:hypothetical protein
MAGLFDLIQSAMGHPDPAMAIQARLGQAPGMPGGPGPQPLVGPPPPGPPAGPDGSPGASGGPAAPAQQQQQQQAQPQPQAYQTPPDLGQMLVQLTQRQQANEQFNRGLAGLTAAFSPMSQRNSIAHEFDNMTGDPGGLMGNLMRLQQYNIEQQQRQQLMQSLPGMLEKAGLDKSYAPLAMANPDFLAKVVEAQTGVTGDPVQRELAQQRAEWHRDPANAGKSDTEMIAARPELASPLSYQTIKTQQLQDTAAKTKDLAADQANFAPAKDAYDSVLTDLDTLRNSKALPDILGSINQYKTKGMIGLPPEQSNALALYDKIMGGQYAAGVQDFKGAGRITQQELKQDLPSQSTMPDRNTDAASFQASIDAFKKKIQTKRAQMFGAAGQLASPDLSDEDYGLVSPIYKPGGSLYVGSQRARPAPTPADGSAPAASSSGGGLKPMPDDTKAAAQALIAKDPTQRGPLISHLRAQGIDPTGL